MKVNKYKEYITKKKELDEIKNELMSILTEYINNNEDFRIKYKIPNKIESVKDMYEGFIKNVIVYKQFHHNIDYIIKLDTKDYTDIIDFIENYDTYKITKKYNL